MNSMTEAVITIAVAIVGVATLAVLVGQKSQTAAVIQAAGSAFGNSLAVAESPVTNANVTPNLQYPGSSGLGQLNMPQLQQGF